MLGSVLKSRLTTNQFRYELARREVNTMFSRARIVGRRMAKLCLLLNEENKINARGTLALINWTSGEMRKYGCNKLLLPYALKVAKEHLQ